MGTYVIGDVQGCLDPLLRLLKQIQFDQNKDFLWFTGDLINRGPHSLETLRFVKALGNRAVTVLGNHDLALLGVACGAFPYQADIHTFQDILQADDRDELIDWLKHRPLLHYDAVSGYLLVHAGLHPHWDLNTALLRAQELETVIRSPKACDFFAHWHHEIAIEWNPKATDYNRLSFIANCLTRLRFCSSKGVLELEGKTSIPQKNGYLPWFSVSGRANRDVKILFGHWAALQGKCSEPNVFALDTGCVWGRCLTAMRLEDRVRFSASC